MYEERSDSDLLRLLSKGSQVAFTELYNRHWKQLYVTARGILQDHAAAEDIVQDVFVSLWRRREGLEVRSPRAYLQQSVRYRVFKAIREGKTDADFYRRLKEVSRDIMEDSPVVYGELQQLLRRLMDDLPEDQRQIFRMNRDEDLTYKDIADRLGISVKTVEKKISCTLRHFRSGLNDGFFLLVFTTLVARQGLFQAIGLL